jgi:hypothetical protein
MRSPKVAGRETDALVGIHPGLRLAGLSLCGSYVQ